MIKLEERIIKSDNSGRWKTNSERASACELWECKDDLLNAIHDGLSSRGYVETFLLGFDKDLPTELEDIRGSICNEPTDVYGYIISEYSSNKVVEYGYFGIDEVEV